MRETTFLKLAVSEEIANWKEIASSWKKHLHSKKETDSERKKQLHYRKETTASVWK